MTNEPAWLTNLLEELADRERYPATPSLAADLLLTLPAPRWRRRRTAAVAGAATLSVATVTLLVLGILRGRVRPHLPGHA